MYLCSLRVVFTQQTGDRVEGIANQLPQSRRKGVKIKMKLGEKLVKLRKEKGLSQEALAEQIGTTRQAVSKWENDQGFPETEKLLQLSNVFEVSVDFLLKDEKTDVGSNEKGYYVSREFARGYLANTKKTVLYLGLCFLFWALAGVPWVLFAENGAWRMAGMAVCGILGILALVFGMFAEEEQYKILRQEPLLFDYDVQKELTAEYKSVGKKCRMIAIPSISLFIIGMIAIALSMNGTIPWTGYHALVFLVFSVSLFGYVYSLGVMEAYELLVRNEAHTGSLWFRVRKKISKRL